MKRNWMTLIAASAAAMMSSAVYAAPVKTAVMEVPFAFHAKSKAMPGGKYQVTMGTSDVPKILIVTQGKTSAMLMATETGYDEKASNKIYLTFTCVASECSLSSAQFGRAKYSLPVRKMSAAEKERIYTITIPATNHKAAD